MFILKELYVVSQKKKKEKKKNSAWNPMHVTLSGFKVPSSL